MTEADKVPVPRDLYKEQYSPEFRRALGRTNRLATQGRNGGQLLPGHLDWK